MYARADARNVTLFSSPHHVCLTLTPSYLARSRFAVAAADNALARMAESQLMRNPTCDRALAIFTLREKSFVTDPRARVAKIAASLRDEKSGDARNAQTKHLITCKLFAPRFIVA